MPISFDKNGIPQYSGVPEDWKQYEERSLDYFYGLNFEERKLAVIRLRSGASELLRFLVILSMATWSAHWMRTPRPSRTMR